MIDRDRLKTLYEQGQRERAESKVDLAQRHKEADEQAVAAGAKKLLDELPTLLEEAPRKGKEEVCLVTKGHSDWPLQKVIFDRVRIALERENIPFRVKRGCYRQWFCSCRNLQVKVL